MNENVTKKQIRVFAAVVIAMLAALIYGFFVLEAGQMDNCWSKYSTEQEAILNCEGTEGTR